MWKSVKLILQTIFFVSIFILFLYVIDYGSDYKEELKRHERNVRGEKSVQKNFRKFAPEWLNDTDAVTSDSLDYWNSCE